jgi:hypothetical protein
MVDRCAEDHHQDLQRARTRFDRSGKGKAERNHGKYEDSEVVEYLERY